MTRWFTRALRALVREERGAVAVAVAVFLTSMVGLTGAAVDMGMFYTAKGELQNAADAAALAAANTMLTSDQNNITSAQPDVAEATASQISQANKALDVPLTMRPEDYTIGFWDFATSDFDPDRTGPSANPDDLTAVRVTLRRDDVANSPVSTMFTRIVGLQQVNLQATSTAFIGWAGSTPAGGVDLPIAVDEWAVNSGDGPKCGEAIEFHSENDENGSWTSFFDWPADDPTVHQYASGQKTAPELKVGDEINITNGNLSNCTFRSLQQRFESEGTDTNGDHHADEWQVQLPVYKHGSNSGSAEVVGFATMVITDVQTAPDKNIVGYLKCGVTIPDSGTSDFNSGSRAQYAKLIQ